MASLSVAEVAARLGVGKQRVHQLVADGALPAARVGSQVVIDEDDLLRFDPRPPGRPLSARSAWDLVIVAADVGGHAGPDRVRRADSLSPAARSRARARLRALLDDAIGLELDEAAVSRFASRLRSMLRSRAERRVLRVSPRDLSDLRDDPRVDLAGLSLPGSGMASADLVEGYVAAEELDVLVDDYLMSPAPHAQANVVLHVADSVAPSWAIEPGTWLLLSADLAEHRGPREIGRAWEIARSAAAADRPPASARPS